MGRVGRVLFGHSLPLTCTMPRLTVGGTYHGRYRWSGGDTPSPLSLSALRLSQVVVTPHVSLSALPTLARWPCLLAPAAPPPLAAGGVWLGAGGVWPPVTTASVWPVSF